jgi:hypothetical protein
VQKAAKKVVKKPAKAARVATKSKQAPSSRPVRKTASRKLRTSAAAHEIADIPAIQWGPPVDAPPTLRVVPQPGAEPAAESAVEPAVAPALAPEPRKRRAAGARAHVPDWADVLLGTAPKRSDD